MIHFAPVDIAIVFLYFAAVLYVGFRPGRKKAEGEDFLLAGRSLTLPVFVMTLVSTWYGGILGVGEFSYRYGISNWVIQGVPYYIFAAIFAAFLAKKVRASNLVSIPDKLEASYDKRTALLGSLLTFILMTPAPYILMLSVFLIMMFGWPMPLALLVMTIVAASYLYWGGFQSDVETDMLEFVLMFAGFAVILPFAYTRLGGSEYLAAHLPPLHLTWHGGNSMQYILVWFFIALWTLVDPAFHQRCYAARDGSVAQRGIFWSILFWLIFDFMTATAGLYARASLPHLDQPMMAYPLLAEELLPPIAKGLFYVGMLATIMSTLNTLAFVSGQTLGRDLILRRKGIPWDEATEKKFTRMGMIVSFALSMALSLLIPSVIQMWYTIGTVVIPGLLVPLMAAYFERWRISAGYAFAAMLSGWLVSLAWLLAGQFNGGAYPLGVEPMYPGLIVSIACWGAGRGAEMRPVKEALP